ncbi:MAG TPA: hypothetical protein VFH78_14915 [Candidatus Thermoplasmatota archaeon]|nr:hypothetical protein [Candidatus Thermoplasmatota archaeon]
MTEETPEQRRARKAAEKEANAKKLEAELEAQYLRPLPERMGFAELQGEHTRLRAKIMEFQGMVIQGKLDVKRAQEFERRMVEQIHRIEEMARNMQTGAHVPRRGE